ncbi:unnamed protein product [Caenorhabditis bovis]|uniref:E3 ubiquitin-protein ligase n=1 Tax=Caenorhabditis bovis TaxID=2654633 RepID=A0A8S1F195_9PELO|nr:unnamed protein product [Caenorhabditis bovis]
MQFVVDFQQLAIHEMLVDLVSAAQKEDWSETRRVLYRHWLTTCPKLFKINADQPWDSSIIDEKAINDQLFAPLVGTFCLDSTSTESNLSALNELAGLDPQQQATGKICGHVFKNGELTYTCRDCATDATCVMCLQCFEESIHKNHKYSMHSSTGSGYCDCGDADAWTDGYACATHAQCVREQGAQDLPEDLMIRCRELVETILEYCISLITHTDDSTLPPLLDEICQDNDVPSASQYLTVLYNDETHTYESVIKVLELYVHCTKDQAMLIATIVDREGRSAVKLGNRVDCSKIKDDIQRKTLRDVNTMRRVAGGNQPLSVKVMDTILFANQNHAIALLNWLNAQIDVFPPLREIVGNVLLNSKIGGIADEDLSREMASLHPSETGDEAMDVDDESLQNQNTLVETVLMEDTDMWKVARSIIHQMLMRTVFMNYDQKVHFAKSFMKHYEHIYEDFISDDHDMDVSIVGLSVQFLTVPSLARRLVAEDDAFTVINQAMINRTKRYVKHIDQDVRRFDFNGNSFPNDLRRALHICRDMAFLLNSVPGEADWSEQLKEKFVRGCGAFIEIAHFMQGMDEVKRQSVEHQVWESEWETAFNILLRIKDAITLIVAWAGTNMEVHNRVLLMLLQAMDKHKITTTDESGETHVFFEVEGESTTLRSFDVLRGGVSIHQPIPRLIAGMFSAHEYVMFIHRAAEMTLDDVQSEIVARIAKAKKDLYELNLRSLVLCAQTNAQLWRRNGFSLINQIHNYYSPLCRSEMFDRDVLMLQVGAALVPTREFLLHLIHRYRIVNWSDPQFEGNPKSASAAGGKIETEDLSKCTVSLAEEFLQVLIMIAGERYLPGVGQVAAADHLRREVIHVLCTGAQTFSHIQHRLSHEVAVKKVSLHEVVNQVAEFRKPLATSAGQFYLKQELLCEYNPFFMHYSKSDQSAAEQHQQKLRQKMDKETRACAPPKLPPFTPFFKNAVEVLRSPILIRILKVIIERTAKRNRFSSDRLFHKALFLVGMALNEEEVNSSFGFTRIAEEESNLLASMEAIQGKPEATICTLLLDFLIQKYKKLRQANGDGMEVENVDESKSRQETADELKAKRAARAREMRQKAMAKMATMQKKFMKQIDDTESVVKKDDETTSSSDDANKAYFAADGKCEYDEDIVRNVATGGQEFPVCIGAHKWKAEIVRERKLTCILCQEDEPIHPINGKPMVCAAFIQQSQLFTHKNHEGHLMTSISGGISTRDLLTAPATLQYGVDVSTCSHSMHFECYKSLSESIKVRDSLRARNQNLYSHKMVDSEIGEYQCPLCKRLSNAAIPVLPAYQLTNVQGFSTISGANNETFDEWVTRVKRHLDMPLGSEGIRKKGHSRKRSHSERSLLDLEKAAAATEKTKDDDASGLLSFGSVAAITDPPVVQIAENRPSTPVPSSSSVMQDLMSTIRSEVVANEDDASEEEFYNELAMLLNQDVGASPTNTPEATPMRNEGANAASSAPAVVEAPKKGLSNQLQHALYSLIRPFPALIGSNRLCANGLEQFEESIKELGKKLIKFRRRGNEKTKFLEKHLRGYVIATVTWQSSAHVARAISSYLYYDGKPLFGALNTRQRDCLSAMARLCASLSHNLQFLLHAVADMLRILCCEPPPPPPKSKAPSVPTSPKSGGTTQAGSSTGVGSTTTTNGSPTNFAFLVQLFNPTGPRKNANLNILHVDMLSLAVSLMMSIGWTWNNGVQTMHSTGSPKARQLTPDGSIDEAYVLRLVLIAHYFQIIATYDEFDGDDVNMDDSMDETTQSAGGIEASTGQLLTRLFAICRPDEPQPRKLDKLLKRMEDGAQILLRPIALLYHFLTLVDPPEALKDPSIRSPEPLFRYLSLPAKMVDQLTGCLVDNLFVMWSQAIPRDSVARRELVVQPVRPNLLIDLPPKYSALINRVATFRCPSIPMEESTVNVPTICLVCGTILCSQAYCCQKIINKQSYGACRYHMSQCSGPVGIFLRVRDCNLVLMATRKRGCFRPAPYVDEFGEVDQGFRRGNPLHLNPDLYQKLKLLWLQQGITEEVVNYNEIDFRNIQYDWAHF